MTYAIITGAEYVTLTKRGAVYSKYQVSAQKGTQSYLAHDRETYKKSE